MCPSALFLVLGLVLYPVGWSSQAVKELCGDYTGPFSLDQCQIGKSIWISG